ncbi:integumentary mucin C.1-like, partial [Actinia tenebrosa]|uniref:Integumentary mucin C.1-like n=1 Tax=Actinia tenebrosa TaxID=6105 RepID=A0A6P8H8B3_ACTTE
MRTHNPFLALAQVKRNIDMFSSDPSIADSTTVAATTSSSGHTTAVPTTTTPALPYGSRNNTIRFTKKPPNPLVVVIGQNSTNVTLTWEFDFTHCNCVVIDSIRIIRYRKIDETFTKKEIGFFNRINATIITDYSKFQFSVRLNKSYRQGHASFFINDIMKQGYNLNYITVDDLLNNSVYIFTIEIAFQQGNETTKTVNDSVDLRVLAIRPTANATIPTISPNTTIGPTANGTTPTASPNTTTGPTANGTTPTASPNTTTGQTVNGTTPTASPNTTTEPTGNGTAPTASPNTTTGPTTNGTTPTASPSTTTRPTTN